MTIYAKLPLVVLLLLQLGCASTKMPQLYPNAHLETVGSDRAKKDRSLCMSLADEYVEDASKYNDLAKDAAIGSVGGAAAGAVGGAILGGNVGRTTAAGAAAGAVVVLVRGLFELSEHSPSYQRFVEYCLQKRGYEIVGWE